MSKPKLMSNKTLRLCLDELARAYPYAESMPPGVRFAVGELREALKPRAKKPMRVEREAKEKSARQTHNAETAAIRAEVEARANGRCECGCGRPFTAMNPMELDHFWGRSRARQSVENTWGLAPICHRMKTRWHPSRAAWLDTFMRHCRTHMYRGEYDTARARLESLALSRQSAEAGRGAR